MSFFKNLFSSSPDNKQFIEEFLRKLFQACGFALYCDVEAVKQSDIKVDLYGGDEELLTDHHGKLLKALQVYISGVLQNRLKPQDKKERLVVRVDSQEFLKRYEEDLLDLAFKLKKKAIKEKRSMYLKRPIEAFYRRKIHQQLSKDGRVATESVGEGAVKTMKIFPLQKRRGHKSSEDRGQ